MINEIQATKYCKNDISLIENYDKAVADKTQIWHCHHRRETIFSRKDLIEIGEYYNRPACELIFLTSLDHNRLHKSGENNPMFGKPSVLKGKHHSAETRKKMSESKKGENNPLFGKHHSAEALNKMSDSKKGENNPLFGKHHSAETRKMMSEANKGKNNWTKGTQWFNNGVKSIRAKTCPEGFVKGRIKK